MCVSRLEFILTIALIVLDSQIKLAQDGDLDPLLKLLRHDDEAVRLLASKAVGNLTYSGTSFIIYIPLITLTCTDDEVVLKGPVGYAPLLEMLKHRDDEVRSKAVWTVAILASNDGMFAFI